VKIGEVVADVGSMLAPLRESEGDLNRIVQATIRVLGMEIAQDGTIVNWKAPAAAGPAWEPPGGLTRPRRTYRNGRGMKK